MDASNWSVIAVALISLASAWLAYRSAKSASKYTSEASIMNSKTLAETEAYNRARKLDTETIDRQKQDILEIRANNEDLRVKVRELKVDNENLHEDNDRLRRRIARLEQQIGELNE